MEYSGSTMASKRITCRFLSVPAVLWTVYTHEREGGIAKDVELEHGFPTSEPIVG